MTKLGQLIHGEVGTFDTELCLNSEQEVTEVELGLESRKPQTFLPMYTGFKNVELTKSTEWSKTSLSRFIYTIHHSIINISFGHRIRPILIVGIDCTCNYQHQKGLLEACISLINLICLQSSPNKTQVSKM